MHSVLWFEICNYEIAKLCILKILYFDGKKI